jgi:hypothetical protein
VSFVGTDYESSPLDYGAVAPDAAQWAQGDQTGSCALFRDDKKALIGSASNPKIQIP